MKTLFTLVAAVFACSAQAASLTGVVTAVEDGDTLVVLDATKVKHKVRLAGIDAPHLKQDFGVQSRQNLSTLALKKEVAVEWNLRDRMKRLVGKVMLDEAGADCAFRSCTKSLDAGLQQIRDGFAWHDKPNEREQTAADQARYAAAETKAKTAKTGLWADDKPVPPWEWREKKKKAR